MDTPTALPAVIDNLNHGGRIALLGLPAGSIDIDWAKVVTAHDHDPGIYGRQMFETVVRDECDVAPRGGTAEGDHFCRH